MLIKYRFSINGYFVNPIHDGGLTKEYQLESGQRFYRTTLVGKIKFQNSDFDWLKSQQFETKFAFLVEQCIDEVWSEYWTGKFFKTDCTFDDINRLVEVKIDADDEYTNVLTGLDKEYNLIKLAPTKTPLKIQKRPLIQLYALGDSVVSCFLNGIYWEQDVSSEITDKNTLVNKYYFKEAANVQIINIPVIEGFEQFAGDYTLKSERQWYSKDGIHKIGRTISDSHTSKYAIYLASETDWNNYLYITENINNNYILNSEVKFKNPGAPYGQYNGLTAFVFSTVIYMRYLLDLETFNGSPTHRLPVDDFINNNRTYKYAAEYAINMVTVSSNTQTEPTEYGLADDGNYFVSPNVTSNNKFYPIARSTWGLSSKWFNFNTINSAFEEMGRKQYVMKDAILISDAIKVLLKEIAPELTHEGTSEYSEFLYGDVNPLSLNTFRLMITQKSNVLAGEYDRPAQKAPIMLSNITKMLSETLKCFWYIENKKFKIEHISWFNNGGRYIGNPLLTVDLTRLLDQRNKKPYALLATPYSYDKADLPERIECNWMDDVTTAFKGYPVVVNSQYVQLGKIDKINSGIFTTDIDYMLLNPEACSLDGFALFGATIFESQYELPFIEIKVDGADLKLQNGILSWIYIHRSFWMHDMPAKSININNENAYAIGILKKKKHTVKYPSLIDPDPMKLVKTYLGNGQIQKVSINLSSRMNEIQLNYDTE